MTTLTGVDLQPEVPTPTLTDHARDRCEEMGISTKVPKAIVRHCLQGGGLKRPGRPGSGLLVVESKAHPDYAAVWDPEDNEVVTVIFNERRFLARNGITCLTETP